jgi:membrane protein EpsK
MIAPLCVNLAILPMFGLNLATDQVRQPALLTFGLGILNVGLALLLSGPFGWGCYGVAAASAILLTAKNVGYMPWFTARSLGLPAATFMGDLGRVSLLTTGTGLVAWGVAHVFPIKSWPMLFCVGGLLATAYLSFVYAAFLKPDEKQEVQNRVVSLMVSLARGKAAL